MSVKKEPDGRRSVQVEVEVPGSPEEVWQAIASGPGISSWFVPARFEESDGKPVAVTLDFGPGMESTSAVTAWNPPTMWSSTSDGWVPGSPSMANEWSVEARGGGKCVVRIVHSLFAETDDWDSQLDGVEHGWPGFFRTLRLYLAHFAGRKPEAMRSMVPFTGTESEAWETLTGALGLKDAGVGQYWTAPAGAPKHAGVVEHLTRDPNDALIRLEQPTPGILSLGTFNCGSIMVAMNVTLFGDQAAATVARESPRWQAWFQERFPATAESAQGG